MAVGEICNREVVIAERSLSVAEAARPRRSNHVGDVAVADMLQDMRRPVGIVTDRDIVVKVAAANIAPDALTVSDIMGPELVTVRESEGVFEVIRYAPVRPDLARAGTRAGESEIAGNKVAGMSALRWGHVCSEGGEPVTVAGMLFA